MRVLAHIHTLNDETVIEQLVEGLRRQTRPPDAIIIVDNGSTDKTLDRTFPENVTIVRNSLNLGTSGGVRAGLAHGLEHGFDWTWLFDADSVPEPDALENLLDFYQSLASSEQDRTCFLACRLANAEGEVRHRPMMFSGSTLENMPVNDNATATLCDCFIWTGSLFRMPAVATIGLPSEDYVLDMAEIEYGYRAQKLGFVSYMVHSGLTQQDVGRPPGVVVTRVWKIGRFRLAFREVSAIRTYYISRNLLYFWLYQVRPIHPRRVVYCFAHAVTFPVNFALRPISHRRHLIAYFRGVWDGLTGHMERRY
jgi:rhamnopyranosyl-N-acetylglucosaminyl-diphospho-decaprenol beta-1,3/1,4-galactofuranosyltransferase